LSLELDAPPVGEPVYVDRDMWEKIVLNLLSNAFKFTLKGGVKVALRKNDERVVLSVCDTGIGIPENELPRLFERFHRIEGAHGRTHEGSGIGLALVQELAKLHGGNVVVESIPGSGSSFRVSVPLGTAHLAQDRLGAPRAQGSTALGAHPYVEEALRWLPESADGQTENAFEQPLLPQPDLSADAGGERATILLADDNADMRDYVRRLLGARYHVETVPDGQAALESIRNRRPDLVLSDVMMPRLDGFALVRALRADPTLANLPIVLLSARAGEDASIEGLETGADDYLVKPFSARELVARVNANVGMARLRQEAARSAAAELQALKRLNAIGNHCVRAGDDLESCLTEILDAAIAFTGADKGNIQLLDHTSSVLEIAVHQGFARPFLDFFARVDRGDAAACGTAMKSAERVIVEDVARSDIFVGQRSLDVLLEAGVRAVQSTPLVSSAGETLGMISTHFSEVHRPRERELGLLDLLARQAADYLERQRAERRVRAISEELRRTLETADVGLARGGRDLRYASANSAYAKIIGRSLEHIVGRPVAEVLGEEVFSAVWPRIQQALRGERVEFEADRRRAGNGAGWIAVVYAPYRNDDGSVTGWVASVTDITDRKVAELALRDNEERFRALVTAGSYVVYRMSPDWTEMLHLDGQDFIATTEVPSNSWLDEYIFPDDQPMVMATIREAIRAKRMFELEHRVRRIDGSVGWTLSRAVPLLNSEGEITEWFGAATDVTARKRAEERLKELNESLEQKVEERSRALEETERRFHLLVEAVADYAIFMLDETGHVVNWNTGARRIKGYSPEEIIGQHFSRFYTEEDRQDGVPERALAMAAHEGRFEMEGWRVRKDGQRFWANVVINGIHDADGRLLGFAKVTRDLTERRAAQERLNQAQKMEAVGQLTGGIAHDFNNLLTVISGNIEALQRRLPGAPEADLRRLASSAQRGAERAAILTHRLLAFSRRQALEPKSLSVNTLVSSMSDMLRRTLGESVAIEIVLAGGVWSTFVDANQLENAVLNLAINARDAMPDGGKLTIETANAYLDDDYAAQADVPSGQYVGIFVSDTGIGMTPETASKAFDPFFTTKELGQGTGLGLSQVYGFIRQSNGHVKIYSELGAGTTVKLYLPRHLSADSANEVRADAQRIPRGAGETILVVDDDADVRSFTVEMLRELGYVTLEAPDGPTGLRLLDGHPEVKLLFTDVGLPGGMNGRQLADEAKRRRARLKVLFASGYARNAIVHHGRLDPGVELLSKPYSFGTLAARVRRVMDER
jgi:PAS domain S-box-containing protein